MIEIAQVTRQAQYAELAGEPVKPVYDDAIRTIIAEIRERQAVLRDLLALRKHRHCFVIDEEIDRSYCDQCGADGDA
jgi:hypothetical protein